MSDKKNHTMNQLFDGVAIASICFVIVIMNSYPPKGWDAVLVYLILAGGFFWLHRGDA